MNPHNQGHPHTYKQGFINPGSTVGNISELVQQHQQQCCTEIGGNVGFTRPPEAILFCCMLCTARSMQITHQNKQNTCLGGERKATYVFGLYFPQGNESNPRVGCSQHSLRPPSGRDSLSKLTMALWTLWNPQKGFGHASTTRQSQCSFKPTFGKAPSLPLTWFLTKGPSESKLISRYPPTGAISWRKGN